MTTEESLRQPAAENKAAIERNVVPGGNRLKDSESLPVSLGDRLFAALQYLLPKHLLSRVIYSIARCESAFVKGTFLRIFLRGYRVNMAEAVEPDPFAYRSF